MRLCGVWVLVCSMSASAAHAGGLCDVTAASGAADVQAAIAPELPGAEALCQEGDHAACVVRYDLQDDAAAAAFESIREALFSCVDASSITRDQGVNHPDFYDAYLFDLGSAAVSLSIKDKSVLGATLVTLRVLPPR